MAVALNDIFLLVANGNWQGQQIRMSLTYAVSNLTAAPSEAAVAVGIIQQAGAQPGGANVLEGAYKACLPGNYTLDSWSCQKVFPNRWRLQTQSRNVAGTNVGICAAPNQAAVITRISDLAGRDEQSNIHVGPIPQDVLTQSLGRVTFAYSGILANLATAMMQPLVSVGLGFSVVPVIYHRGRVPSASFITNYAVQSTLRVMRRRTVGVGK